MKTSELRIGNKILCNKEEIEVCINDFCEWEDNESTYSLEPILLTDEIFINLGFEENDGSFILKDNIGEITRYYYDGWNMTFEFEFSSAIVYGIEYVHQLQNIYYALTGKEIDCSLTKH